MNCSDRCVYPNYGYYCQNTCDCTVTDCNHVLGCKGNYTQIETSTSLWSKYTSSRNDYIHSLKINEGMSKLLLYYIILPHNYPKLIPEVYIMLKSNNIKQKMNILIKNFHVTLLQCSAYYYLI